MKYLTTFFFLLLSYTIFAQNTPLRQDVYFGSGSYALSQESIQDLWEIALTLQASPSYTLILTGHTDNVGNADANQQLSEYRVAAVYHYLLQCGLKGEWISADYFGANQPSVNNVSEIAKQKNRRVEVSVFYYPPKEPAVIKCETVVPSHRQKSH